MEIASDVHGMQEVSGSIPLGSTIIPLTRLIGAPCGRRFGPSGRSGSWWTL